MNINNILWQNILDLKNKSATENCFGWAFDGTSFSELLNETDLKDDYSAVHSNDNYCQTGTQY